MPKVIRPSRDSVKYECENPDNPRGYKLTEEHQNPTIVVDHLTRFNKSRSMHGIPTIEFWFSNSMAMWMFISNAERDQAYEEIYAAVSE